MEGRPAALKPGGALSLAALAAVLLGTSLLVDTAAEAAFEAPKRLAAVLGIALAGVLLLFAGATRSGPETRRARQIRRLVLGALAAACASALLSPRRAVSLDALRGGLLFAALLPLGASRLLEAGRSAVLLGAFLGACALDALVSILQALQWYQPFSIESVTGRTATGAFIGNEGQLALLLALACVAALALLLFASGSRLRWAAAAGVLLYSGGLLVNLSFTALLALLAGAAALLGPVLGRRALGPLLAALLIAAAGVGLYPPFRYRVAEIVQHAQAGEWNAVLTNRLGPWAAALEMTLERPVLGGGPGTFAAEYVPHRLQAEIRLRERLLIPKITTSFGEAHSEVLQALAELGIPATLALLAAAGLLLGGLLDRSRRAPEPELRHEAALLLALLCTGAVGALAWFPLQRPSTAAPLLLAAGRAWRLLGGREPGARARGLLRLAPGLLLVAALMPEPGRSTAEQELSRAVSMVRALRSMSRDDPAWIPAAQRARALALQAAGRLPGDTRGLLAAGAVDLLARRPQEAMELYRQALALGERAEIDLNLGRAYAILDQRPQAFAAFVRTAWINPLLVPDLPKAAQPLVEAEMARLEGLLRSGALSAPPPLP